MSRRSPWALPARHLARFRWQHAAPGCKRSWRCTRSFRAAGSCVFQVSAGMLHVRYFRDQNGAHCHDSHTCAEATGAAAIGAFGSVLTGPDAASAAAMGGTDVDW